MSIQYRTLNRMLLGAAAFAIAAAPVLPNVLPAAIQAQETADAAISPVVLPDAQWQRTASFPDQAGYVDDTLIMNSRTSFDGFKGQGTLYVEVSPEVESFRLFVNNSEISTRSMSAGTYAVDIAGLTVNGKNSVQVTTITPDTLASGAVKVYMPYPTVVEGTPEEVGMDSSTLEALSDYITAETKYGFSGAQMAVVKDGKMVYSNAWGIKNGYNEDGSRIVEGDEKYDPVTTDTLYDLASNSKMYSVNYAIQYMLSNEGYDLNLDDPITKFFPQFDDEGVTIFKEGTTEEEKAQILAWKSQLTVRDILKHQAGFDPDPQYHNDKFNQLTQKPDANVDNPLFSQDRDTTRNMVLASPLTYEPGTKTVYSDVDYMLLCFIIEQVAGMGMDEFLDQAFWTPMGLDHITYNPLDHGFSKDDCAATELNGNSRDGVIDFANNRTGTIQGTVHDEKAYYAMGGVSGHAGLFANAEDLARLCNLMITGGDGENRFFDKNILDEFTKPKSADLSTWGLGWWRNGEVGRYTYFTTYASEGTIGHQGWTGTLTVIDPEENLVITLLTNKKNSPVLDPNVAANDFYSDNMVLGNLGNAIGYVFESMKSSPDGVDESIKSFAENRVKTLAAHKGAYDENAHMNDAFALADWTVTRAEKRRTARTKENAQNVLDALTEQVELCVDGSYTGTDYNKDNVENAARWSAELQERINAITTDAEDSLHYEAAAVAGPMASTLGEDQNALYWPQWGGTGYTSRLYNTNVSWFQGYEGQGTMSFEVYKPMEDVKIFINGHAVDTSAMLNTTGTFNIDVSGLTVNGRNSIQVTCPYDQARSSMLMVMPNPTVIDETGNANAVEEAGLSSESFDLIDTITRNDIAEGFTSAQLAVLKDGKMVYSNAWGKTNSYNPDGSVKTDSADVTTETLYDLASNTKMYATNYAIQYLVGKGQISLSDPITKYFPSFVEDTIEIAYDTNWGTGAQDLETAKAWKSELTVQDILQHQAGFAPDPQFHNDKFNQATQTPDANTENVLYATTKEKVAEAVCKSPLVYRPGTKTVYSDVDYITLGLIIEQVSGKSLNEFLKETFWQPMGLESITYNPLENGFSADQIAATELNGNSRDGAIDFTGNREGTIQGTVHDEKAYYAMNGESGHAGLFANAETLGRLASAMLNHNGYGNARLFSYNVNDYFTSRKDSTATWGQGWWRNGDNGRPWYFSTQASRNTIGHQGWTGTLTAIDPEENLVIVYLTNKINSPVTDPDTAPSQFDGNWYTSATLGHIAEIIYAGLEDRNCGDVQTALDAVAMTMPEEHKKLVSETDVTHPNVRAWYAVMNSAMEIAAKRPTDANLAAARKAFASLDPVQDKVQRRTLMNKYGEILGIANTCLLEDAIDYADAQVEAGALENLNEIVKNEFNTALSEAKALLEKENVTQEEVNNAWIRLSRAIQMLSFKSDKTELLLLIKRAEAITEATHTGDFETLNKALAAAREAAASDTALDESIQKAAAALEAAINNMNAKTVDTTVLEYLIAQIEAVNLEDYLNTKGEVDALKAELEKAKELVKNPESQSAVDAQTSSLHNAWLSLRLKPTEDQLENLKNFQDTVNNLDLNLFTEASANKIKDLHDRVNAALKNPELDRKDAAALVEEVKAMNDLLKNPDADKKDPVKPGEEATTPSKPDGENTDKPSADKTPNKKPSAGTAAATMSGIAALGAALSAGLFAAMKRRNRK